MVSSQLEGRVQRSRLRMSKPWSWVRVVCAFYRFKKFPTDKCIFQSEKSSFFRLYRIHGLVETRHLRCYGTKLRHWQTKQCGLSTANPLWSHNITVTLSSLESSFGAGRVTPLPPTLDTTPSFNVSWPWMLPTRGARDLFTEGSVQYLCRLHFNLSRDTPSSYHPRGSLRICRCLRNTSMVHTKDLTQGFNGLLTSNFSLLFHNKPKCLVIRRLILIWIAFYWIF